MASPSGDRGDRSLVVESMLELSFPPVVHRWLMPCPFHDLVFRRGSTLVSLRFCAPKVAELAPLTCSLLGPALFVCFAPLTAH